MSHFLYPIYASMMIGELFLEFLVHEFIFNRGKRQSRSLIRSSGSYDLSKHCSLLISGPYSIVKTRLLQCIVIGLILPLLLSTTTIT